jgi:L-ascorbate metabolism protein UlaG (beta-lactamase superfamily)
MPEALGFTFIWYGHSCMRLETQDGTTILFDPWFGNPKSPADASSVDRCDVMLVSHGHFDHIGSSIGDVANADAVTIARRTKPVWPCVHELSLWLERQPDIGAEVIGMNKGGTVSARGVSVTMVHADHSAGDWDGPSSTPLYLGEPAGFVVELPGGPRIYFAGDTALFGDMRLIGEQHAPDVAFLPIGGHFTMGPFAAAKAVELLAPRIVVPIHYGTFPVLTGTPDALRAELERLGLGSIVVLSPARGEAVS